MSFLLQLFKSRTVIFNIAALVVGVASYLQGQELVSDNPELVGILGTIVAVGNIILRLKTTVPVLAKSALLSDK